MFVVVVVVADVALVNIRPQEAFYLLLFSLFQSRLLRETFNMIM